MALKYGDKVKFVGVFNVFVNPLMIVTVQISIDVDELPQLCNRVLGVRFMPVIIAVKNGIKFKQ